MPIGKKIVEIPESEVSEIFVKQFIIAFDKVNRQERFGPTSIECIREIDIITKKNNANYVILANINDGGESIYAGHAKVVLNEEELLRDQIDILRRSQKVEICRIVERTLNLMHAHRVYEEFYKTSHSLAWKGRNLIEEGRELLISELIEYVEKLQKEESEPVKVEKKWWNIF